MADEPAENDAQARQPPQDLAAEAEVAGVDVRPPSGAQTDGTPAGETPTPSAGADEPARSAGAPGDGAAAGLAAGQSGTDGQGAPPDAGEPRPVEAHAMTEGQPDAAEAEVAMDGTKTQATAVLEPAEQQAADGSAPGEQREASRTPAGDGGAEEAAAPFEEPDLTEASSGTELGRIELLDDVELEVKIELGRTEMYIEDVVRLEVGSVVELDKLAGDPVDIYVNERLIARGEVLVLDDNFCVRVNDILSPIPELESA
jgi:flagellar motor switch protein FliN/FliY